VRRREFLAGLGGAVAWPLASPAQEHGIRRVGVLMDRVATDTRQQAYLAAFTQGLHKLGWNEGDNLHVDVRWSAGDVELARIYAAQLIGQMPNVILASTTNNLIVVRQATSTVPVVFVVSLMATLTQRRCSRPEPTSPLKSDARRFSRGALPRAKTASGKEPVQPEAVAFVNELGRHQLSRRCRRAR
jgi:hypothetical protein